MSVVDWIVSIILFIVSLGVLIIIHELGHLSMAKLFKVYCKEFSIGFGPAIIHKKPKGKETYISLRAIPFGGYVSMYGEQAELEEDDEPIPPERSLEGIKKWKKAIILAAGVTLNAVLALTLFAVSNICFPLIKATTISTVKQNSIAEQIGIVDGDTMQTKYYLQKEGDKAYMVKTVYYEYKVDNTVYMGYFTMVDNDIVFNDSHYVWTYYPVGNKSETSFISGGKLYPAVNVEQVNADPDLKKAYQGFLDKGELSYYPNFKSMPYNPHDAKTEITAKIDFLTAESQLKRVNVPLKTVAVEGKTDEFQWQEIGLSFKLISEWQDFGTRVKNTFVDFGNASVAVFKGLGVLFTGGFKNVSGIIGVLQSSATIYGTYAFSTYLYYWGMISVNLAIFNLFPFPGLDGFALLITAIEGISKKKVPTKFKSIMSAIGLTLLFGLMIVILVFDILRWAGI